MYAVGDLSFSLEILLIIFFYKKFFFGTTSAWSDQVVFKKRITTLKIVWRSDPFKQAFPNVINRDKCTIWTLKTYKIIKVRL